MSVSGTMTMLPKNWFQPPIRRRRRVKYSLTPPLQHFRRRPRLIHMMSVSISKVNMIDIQTIRTTWYFVEIKKSKLINRFKS